MAAPMRLPIIPPMAAPATVPSPRLPAAPPIALPIAAPAPAPTSVPPTSFGPESHAQAASAAPNSATARTRPASLGLIAFPSNRLIFTALGRRQPDASAPHRKEEAAIGAKLL